MAPHEYEALSRVERLRRIGALFSKAVVISLARKQALAPLALESSAVATEIVVRVNEEETEPDYNKC